MKKKSGRGPRKPPNGPDEVFPHAFSSCVIKFRCKYEIHSQARRCFGEALCSCLHLHQAVKTVGKQASNVGLPMRDLVSPSPNFAGSFDYKQLSSKQPSNLLNTTNQNRSKPITTQNDQTKDPDRLKNRCPNCGWDARL